MERTKKKLCNTQYAPKQYYINTIQTHANIVVLNRTRGCRCIRLICGKVRVQYNIIIIIIFIIATPSRDGTYIIIITSII